MGAADVGPEDRRRADVRERDHRDVAADEVVHPAVGLRACRGVGRETTREPASDVVEAVAELEAGGRPEMALQQDAGVRVTRPRAEQVEPAESPRVDGRGQLLERHDGQLGRDAQLLAKLGLKGRRGRAGVRQVVARLVAVGDRRGEALCEADLRQ